MKKYCVPRIAFMLLTFLTFFLFFSHAVRPLDVKILTKSTPTISSSKVTPFSSVSSSSGHSSPAIVLAAGSKAEFQCRSIGSRPSAQISWWLGPERLSSNVRDSVNEDGNATISTITFVPDLEDNGKMLTCRADNLPMPHTALKDEKLLNVHCKFLRGR